jgi:hypothetical protein
MERSASASLAVCVAILALLTDPTRAMAGDAMDLERLEPRWVEVQVVTTSPGDPVPRFSEPVAAWYEAEEAWRTVTIPGGAVERIFFAERSPVEQCFSDFVWVFDAATGHVTSASFSGLVDEPIRIGPVRSSARVRILVALSTRVTGGYDAPRELAGRTVIAYCPDVERAGCTAVTSSTYDPESGWVRANGAVCAVWHSFRTLAYTSLGQARFRELDRPSELDALHAHARPGSPPSDRTGDPSAC